MSTLEKYLRDPLILFELRCAQMTGRPTSKWKSDECGILSIPLCPRTYNLRSEELLEG